MNSSPQTGWSSPARQAGLILPHLDSLTEPILARTLLPQIEFHVSRMRRVGSRDETSLASMNAEVEAAADRLPTPFLDLVVYHCTSGSALSGRELERQISARTALPTLTTASAVEGALSAIGARNVCLITPYVPALAARERQTIESSGFSIVAEGGRQMADGVAIQRVEPVEIAEWVMSAVGGASGPIDAVFIACTGLRSAQCAEVLERDVGVPIVTSTTAMIRWLFQCFNIPCDIAGYGSLLAHCPA